MYWFLFSTVSSFGWLHQPSSGRSFCVSIPMAS